MSQASETEAAGENTGIVGMSETRATGPEGGSGARKAAGTVPDPTGGDPPATGASAAGAPGAESGGGASNGTPADAPAAVPLLDPREGVPPVVADAAALDRVIAAFAAGNGPVAVDAERASGYRYGQRAYLVQLRRAGAGTALIDPVGCPDLSGLDAALADAEIVLHAANQDLPCLAEVGLVPRRLFDTELAGRLLGYPRVGLGSMVENVLGFLLEKGYSAADWSTRPLPEDWLRYAALDVELLVELRDALHGELVAAGKLDWALEEFEAILATPPKPPRADPWRRTSGIHRVRNRRALAIVRSVWEMRDKIARERDLSPGRVLQDAAIIELAQQAPQTVPDLQALPTMRGRAARRHQSAWLRAVARARELPDRRLPAANVPGEGPPPAHRWADRDPEAAKRLTAARAVVAALAEEHSMPSENLLQPDVVRRLAWTPPDEPAASVIGAELRRLGARRWQAELTAQPIARAFLRLETKNGL
ncbi:ribonuclease D [Actinomadura algeriensis]|uniref:Ribonuclease D n=1 Tax=Actinomadura algeriensis TaxID=1679523 RepID=A0ABR9K4R0_9ACTN|nr:ribonuclease D [Actinomadura algeriensis]MBE1537614.1 ribonuclease D [Actinomadura algeriensis]